MSGAETGSTIVEPDHPPHASIDGQAIGTYDAKGEVETLRKPHLLRFAAHPIQRVVMRLQAS